MAKWKVHKVTHDSPVAARLAQAERQVAPQWIVVSPAYGRDYRNSVEAIHAWLEGKDFILESTGQYCSDRNFGPEVGIEIRFNRKADLAVIDPEDVR